MQILTQEDVSQVSGSGGVGRFILGVFEAVVGAAVYDGLSSMNGGGTPTYTDAMGNVAY